MNTMIEVDVCGFDVPNSLVIKDGCGVEGESVDITKIDPLTLDRLCDDFRFNVFAKAGKNFPPLAACSDCGKTLG